MSIDDTERAATERRWRRMLLRQDIALRLALVAIVALLAIWGLRNGNR